MASRGAYRAVVFAAGAWATLTASGCQPLELSVAIDVVLPADDSPLSRTNNVSLVLEPLGTVQTIAAQGTDFSLSLSLEPQSDPQTISLFLAEDDTLLAWGKTPPVALSGGSSGLSLLVAVPEAMSSFEQEFDAPDPQARAAAVGDIGMLVVASDGTALFLDVFGWQLRAAAPIPSDALLDPADGTLVPDPSGGVQRIGIREGLSVQRFDPIDNAWHGRAVDADAQARFDQRPDAPLLLSAAGSALWVLGGGEHRDVLAVALNDEGNVQVDVVGVPALDAPRPGAAATLVTRGAGQLTATVLFGADDTRAVGWLVERGVAFGPPGPWTGAACTPLDGPDADVPLRVLCVGGQRDGVPTADGVVLTVPPVSQPDVAPWATELPALLIEPMAAPLALRGASAVYAQGDGRAVRIAVADLHAEVAPSSDRVAGGSVAALPLGVTFIVGGVANNDVPQSRWATFIPSPG